MGFLNLYKGDNMNLNKILKKLKNYRNNEDISIQELNNIVKINEEAILLDVRSPQEYREGHLNRINQYTII